MPKNVEPDQASIPTVVLERESHQVKVVVVAAYAGAAPRASAPDNAATPMAAVAARTNAGRMGNMGWCPFYCAAEQVSHCDNLFDAFADYRPDRADCLLMSSVESHEAARLPSARIRHEPRPVATSAQGRAFSFAIGHAAGEFREWKHPRPTTQRTPHSASSTDGFYEADH